MNDKSAPAVQWAGFTGVSNTRRYLWELRIKRAVVLCLYSSVPTSMGWRAAKDGLESAWSVERDVEGPQIFALLSVDATVLPE